MLVQTKMKALIIHTLHKKSIEYANKTLNSFSGHIGWEPELFEGVTVQTLQKFEELYDIKIKKESRAITFSSDLFKVKKSCFLNHYRLFHKCLEINEPLAVIEHDSHCIGDWIDLKFDDILIMNYNSAIRQHVFKNIWNKNPLITKNGLSDIDFSVKYKFEERLKAESAIPGTAAYAITPSGAAKMLKAIHTYGWDQSDYVINTGYVRIQCLNPELFTFKLPNLRMSHGE